MTTQAKVFIGTSGWNHDFDRFYPPEQPKTRRFDYYRGQFSSVEVNFTFYNLPQKKTMQKWYEQASADFCYTLKLSRYITHTKRLTGSKTAFRKFIKRALPLQEKLGPILIQLPPNFQADAGRLDEFLTDARDVLKEEHQTDHPLALEFRHESWFTKNGEGEQARNVMRRHNAAIVLSHSTQYPQPSFDQQTANFTYVRFHGPGELFASAYGKQKLRAWAKRIRSLRDNGHDIYAYFNNTDNGDAPIDAQILRDLL